MTTAGVPRRAPTPEGSRRAPCRAQQADRHENSRRRRGHRRRAGASTPPPPGPSLIGPGCPLPVAVPVLRRPRRDPRRVARTALRRTRRPLHGGGADLDHQLGGRTHQQRTRPASSTTVCTPARRGCGWAAGRRPPSQTRPRPDEDLADRIHQILVAADLIPADTDPRTMLVAVGWPTACWSCPFATAPRSGAEGHRRIRSGRPRHRPARPPQRFRFRPLPAPPVICIGSALGVASTNRPKAAANHVDDLLVVRNKRCVTSDSDGDLPRRSCRS